MLPPRTLFRKTLRSSTFRLAILYVGLFSVSVAALFAYVYWSTAAYLRSRYDAGIVAEQRLLLAAFDRGGAPALTELIAARRAAAPADGDLYLVADAGYAPLAGNLLSWPSAARDRDDWIEFAARDWRPEAEAPPLLRAVAATLPDGTHLLVGKDIDDTRRFVEVIRRGVALGVALFCAMALAAGISVTRRTVSRIEAINATSRAIMASGLGQRIPLRGTRDEWDQLAANLNSMLDRIEELVREVGQVSDNVAHDLRTPLTRLRGRLEKASHDALDPERAHALVADTMRELDAVLGTFSSLLRISRIEARDPRATFRVVDLDQVAGEVAELFDAAAEEKGGRVKFESGGRVPVLGDRDLLF